MSAILLAVRNVAPVAVSTHASSGVDHQNAAVSTLELLEMSRIDAGIAELRREDIDVVTATEHVLADQGVPAGVLCDELGSNRLHALDRTRFERVVANYVENAARYAVE